MDKKTNEAVAKAKNVLAPFKACIKRPAKGKLPYDYLVPSGYYSEQWDWDAFFMGVGLASEISSEAIYLRNWALNYIVNADETGYSPGCVTPKGPEGSHRKFVMKPFLAQGAYLAGKFLRDFSWITTHWNNLKRIVLYRERHLWDKDRDLGMWTNVMESGMDDNVAGFGYANATVIAPDVNTYIFREYRAMHALAKTIGKRADAVAFKNRAASIRKNIQTHLWNDQDRTYYSLDRKTGKHLARITISNFIPLWEILAPPKNGRESIQRYLLSPDHLWSKYGIRTLSKSDPQYNNENRIKPYSNWQGPVWPIANYFYLHALLNYGFQKEAIELSKTIFTLVENDIKKTGSMHENYDAETGKPLAAPNFVSWNIVVGNMLEEAMEQKNPFRIEENSGKPQPC